MLTHTRTSTPRGYRPGRLTAVSLALAGVLCGACAHAVPVITYQQIANFREYEYAAQTGVPNGHAAPPGEIFSLYRITSVQNQGKNAAPFTFSLARLYSGSAGDKELAGNGLIKKNSDLGMSDGLLGFITPLSFTEVIGANQVRDYKSGQIDGSLAFVILHKDGSDPNTVDPLKYQPDGPNVALPVAVPSSYTPVFIARATAQKLLDAMNAPGPNASK